MKNNRLFLPISYLLVFTLLFSSMFTFFSPVHADTVTATATILSPASDGYLYNSASTYASAHNALTGTVYNSYNYIVGGQILYGNYGVDRSCLFFDTSVVPDGATIENATLSLYVIFDESDTDFNVTIQSSTNYPHLPIQSSDFYFNWYSGNGGSRNTSEIAGAGYWNITLSSTGESYVNDEGYTRLMLRSSNDIANTAPTGNEYVTFNSRDAGEAYAPKLYVTYTVSGASTIIIHGPYLETGTVYNGTSVVTVSFANNSTQASTLDGTDGDADSMTIASDALPTSMFWNVTSDLTKQRTYVFTEGDTFDEVWVFVPDTTDVIGQYYVSITDFAGLTDAYVNVRKNVNGTTRTIERQALDVLNNIPFWLITYSQYSLKLECNEGVYSWSLPADSVGTKSFVVTKDMVETEIENQNFTVSATRPYADTITIYYYDPSEITVQVTTNILTYDADGWTTVYSDTVTDYTQSFTWSNADNSTDYYANVTAYFTSGESLNWLINLPIPASDTDYFGNVLDFIGDAPFPLSQLPGLFIVGLIFAIGSWKDAEFICGAGVVVAAFLWYIGLLNIPVTGIAMGFGVVVFMFIHRGKETMRNQP